MGAELPMEGAPAATGLATAVGLAGAAWCCASWSREPEHRRPRRDKSQATVDTVDARELSEDWWSEAGQEALRATEFARIGDAVYLDHAGATLHSERQLSDVMAQLNGRLYGNPHSQNESSTRASDALRRAREATLRHFNTSAQQYDIIFTANATAALKLVGESFPWSDSSEFAYTVQNHNSVLGIREYAAEHGAQFSALKYNDLLAQVTEGQSEYAQSRPCGSAAGQQPTHSLFAFPGECNFSGQKLDLRLIDLFQSGQAGRAASTGEWCVLLDAAKLAATSTFDLSKYPVDFMCISFYKMFGYPTGLGALLVRRDRAPLLRRSYFGGGTVGAAISDQRYHVLRAETDGRFEDGTVSFLSIAALPVGFAQLQRLGMAQISEHTHALAVYTHDAMAALHHAGQNAADPVVKFYGYSADPSRHGSVLNFNLLRPASSGGGFVGYREVEKLASIHGIHLRTGGFCNPGASQTYLELSHAQVKEHVERGHVCWDDHDLIDGVPTGSVRVSFGYMSTLSDAQRFVGFIEKYFVATKAVETEAAHPQHAEVLDAPGAEISVSQVRVYPIKSCAAMEVQSWPIGPNGLLFDREWIVVDSTGTALSLKNESRLTLIKPSIDMSRGLLTIRLDESRSAYGTGTTGATESSLPPLVLSLEDTLDSSTARSMQVCGDMCTGRLYSGDTAAWFTAALRRECSLARRPPGSAERSQQSAASGANATAAIGFANEGQILVVGEESVQDLQRRLPPDCDLVLTQCYTPHSRTHSPRPNRSNHRLLQIPAHVLRRSLRPHGCL